MSPLDALMPTTAKLAREMADKIKTEDQLMKLADHKLPRQRERILQTISCHRYAVLAIADDFSPARLVALGVGMGDLAVAVRTHNIEIMERVLFRLAAYTIGWHLAISNGLETTKLVHAERERQKQLFQDGCITFNVSSPIIDARRKYGVLLEEAGEVAQAVDRLEQHVTPAREAELRMELIQVAAVSVAWLESLEDGQ